MTITVTRMIKLAVILAGLTLAATFLLASARARTGTDDFDAAAAYRAKCFACHGAKAEKKFDATKAEGELVQTVLKGRKLEKPPNMPGYEEKGVTGDQAKALVAHMKSIQ